MGEWCKGMLPGTRLWAVGMGGRGEKCKGLRGRWTWTWVGRLGQFVSVCILPDLAVGVIGDGSCPGVLGMSHAQVCWG